MHKILTFPKILDPRGNLTFLQNNEHFPFNIKRIFWTYDVPGGQIRGGHAYQAQNEVIIALSGSFDVIVKSKDGSEEKITLNRSYNGLFLSPLTWRWMENFSTNSVSLHLTDKNYEAEDYIRDFEEFKKIL